MVSHAHVLSQLTELGIKFRFFGRAEVKELANIIGSEEQIRHCVSGSYQGGRALLVATNRRILLVDKRPFFLNLEDIRYEMISDVYFAGRLLNAKMSLQNGNKVLEFTSISDARLRKLCEFTQDQITKARQLEHMHEGLKPAQGTWSPYNMLGSRSHVSKYTGHILTQKYLEQG